MKRLYLVAVTIAAAYAASATAAKPIHRELDVAPGGTLVVDTVVGGIEVSTHGKDSVDIEVERKARHDDELEVDISKDDKAVKVIGQWREKRSSRRSRVQYRIMLPKKFNVNLKTRGGSIEVTKLTGTTTARTSGGSLHFERIDGPIKANTSGGSISLSDTTGDVDVNTSGGSINVGDVQGRIDVSTSGGSIDIGKVTGSITAHTSGGSIHIDNAGGAVKARTSGGSIEAYISEQPHGDSELSTSGGSATVYLAKNIAVDLDARAGSGRVKSDFDVAVKTHSKHSLEGKINGGGPRLVVRASGGGVKIRRR